MYQNRLGPSGGIYHPNFVPCFVVLFVNGLWINDTLSDHSTVFSHKEITLGWRRKINLIIIFAWPKILLKTMHFFKSRQCTSYRRCLMHTKKANNGRRCRSKKKVTAFCCLSSIKKGIKNTWILQVAVKAGKPCDNWIVCTALLLHLTWSRVEANSRQSLCIKLGNPLNVSRKLRTKHLQRVEHRKVSLAGVCNERSPMLAASPHAGLESGQPSCRRHKIARRTVQFCCRRRAYRGTWLCD